MEGKTAGCTSFLLFKGCVVTWKSAYKTPVVTLACFEERTEAFPAEGKVLRVALLATEMVITVRFFQTLHDDNLPLEFHTCRPISVTIVECQGHIDAEKS